MHILIIPSERYIPKDAPMTGMFQQHQAQALKRAGYKVGILSPPELRSLRLLRKGLSGWQTGVRVGDDQGIPVFKYYSWSWIPQRFQTYIWLRLQAWRTLFKRYVTQQGMPEIIHAHNARFSGLLASKIKKEWHIPYVLTEHSSEYVRGLIRSSEIADLKDAFKHADKRIVVSPGLGHVLERIIGDSFSPWDWVPNILDVRFERNPPLRKSEDHPNRRFCFLNVGSLVEVKGQRDLLGAFAMKFEGKSDIQLRIGGNGPLRKKLEILSSELRIDKQVVFLGELSREQVLTEMQACDALVLSSHVETFGVVLIEALACGKPVIATACGGPECIVHKENGVLVSPHDIMKLGEAMEDMRENIDRYDSARIRNDCIARFGEQTVVGQLSKIYSEVRLQALGSK
jgi:glycosyltransferase involved in cell wall biosynthesis